MSHLQYSYQALLNSHQIKPDPQQAAVIEKMVPRFDALVKIAASQKKPKFFSRFSKKKCVAGLYLWGEVGIGKTFLLDLFFDALPFKEKKRQHFHVFMRDLHEQLKALQGLENPLKILAQKIRREAIVLCFDEMHVEDIADAMLLGDLLQYLFQAGICFITTSNQKPDDLYLGGLQRKRFLPAIECIKKNTEVIHLLSKMDYRQQHLKEVGSYFFPLNATAAEHMEKSFLVFASDDIEENKKIMIQNRFITVKKISGRVAWFTFFELCETNRSQLDYLELTKSFEMLFLSAVPDLTSVSTDVLMRFIRLIDVLYDAHTGLVLSAAVALRSLYRGEEHRFAFQRTASRLVEMTNI